MINITAGSGLHGCDVEPSGISRRFEVTYCLHLEGSISVHLTDDGDTFPHNVREHPTTQRDIPKDRNSQSRGYDNVKTRIQY
jgi:hypothetical protein